MKNIVNSKPQLVTKVIYLIPFLLVYTLGLCIAHVLSSESDVTLAHIDRNKLIDRPVYATPVPASAEKRYADEEIEPFHDFLRRIARVNASRIARADAAKALEATRQSVLHELQENVSNSLYAFKTESSDLQLVAENDGQESLAATRQAVLNELQENNVSPLYAIDWDYNNLQLISDEDGRKSLDATRTMVLASLKDNVNDLFHDQFQYLGDPKADEKRIVSVDPNSWILPSSAAYKIADKSQ